MSNQFFPPDVTPDDRLWAALAYIVSPLSPILILLTEDKRNRPFIRAHTAQALLTGMVFLIVISILTIPTLGMVNLIWLVMLYWAFRAYRGGIVEIPVISNFVRNQGWA